MACEPRSKGFVTFVGSNAGSNILLNFSRVLSWLVFPAATSTRERTRFSSLFHASLLVLLGHGKIVNLMNYNAQKFIILHLKIGLE